MRETERVGWLLVVTIASIAAGCTGGRLVRDDGCESEACRPPDGDVVHDGGWWFDGDGADAGLGILDGGERGVVSEGGPRWPGDSAPEPPVDGGPAPSGDAGPALAMDAGPALSMDAGPAPSMDAGPAPSMDSGPAPSMDSGPAPEPDAGPPPEPDAGPRCGDRICGLDESCESCPGDCGGCVCGDASCQGNGGETCVACAADCDTRAPACGNGECQSGERSTSCLPDCGPAPWPTGWRTFEAEVVRLINARRAAGATCPTGRKPPAGPLSLNLALRRMARLHSWDMAYSNYFDHVSCNGRAFTDRAAAQGVTVRGENIGSGYRTPEAVVEGWMISTLGHCEVVMHHDLIEVGVGYSEVGSQRRWTANFR